MIVDQAVQRARILVVDDQVMTSRLIEKALKRAGFRQVTACTDPRQVMTLVDASQPDLIVLDLRMPHLDGMAILQELRVNDREAGPVVLILTAEGSPVAKARAIEAGADAFMTKPFDFYDLLETLEHLLKRRLRRR